MASYVYDDFRVTLTPRDDGTYDVHAHGPDGVDHTGIFVVPFADAEMERAVLGVARGPVRSTRDVGGGEPPELDAERLGGALAAALLTAAVAEGYDEARRRAAAANRGLRLTLSLAGAPPLLSLPWELLYRAPRYFANQRQTPLVRHLETAALPQPPAIDSVVRILGVVSSPADCSPLDLAGERHRVEQAVAEMVALGRVQLDWLETPTRRALRTKLRDGKYHVLHYVGHSDFTPAGEGVLYLQDDAGNKAELDNTELANLLSDQNLLRLVVLNSCEGARTTLTDPFAGVATTLMQLGVPAVVAMQFEISDEAAILFASELYTNLIGRQDPIDAAVAEARKAVYIELQTVEWATPVLFMGDVDVELFHFQVAAAPLPPPPPPQLVAPEPAPPVPAPDDGEPPKPSRRTGSILVKVLAGVGGGVVLLLLIAFIIGAIEGFTEGDDDEAGAGDVTTPVTAGVTAANAAPTTASAQRGEVAGVTGLAVPLHVTGSVDEPDGVSDHPVDLAQGQIVYLRGSGECGVNVTYQLLSPSGTALSGAPYVCSDHDRVVAPMAGTYTVQVSSWDGGTGPYDVEVVPVPPDDVVDVAVGDSLTGELTVSGEHDQYRFTATAGDSVYLDGRGACEVYVEYILTSPSNVDMGGGAPYACNDMGRIDLPQSGQYTVTVRSYLGGTGPYSVDLLAVPPDTDTFVAVGDRLQGEITASGEQHYYAFDASAGDVVVLDGAEPCGVNVSYILYSPDAVPLSGEPYVCNDVGPTELPLDGTYFVVVSSWEGGTGPYDIALQAA
ncbi:MAG: CHAT domain-containing protein [Ilumatobacteraceae bacterium]